MESNLISQLRQHRVSLIGFVFPVGIAVFAIVVLDLISGRSIAYVLWSTPSLAIWLARSQTVAWRLFVASIVTGIFGGLAFSNGRSLVAAGIIVCVGVVYLLFGPKLQAAS